MSKPSPPSEETGTSSVVEVGVAGTCPPPPPLPPLWRERGAVGVASEEANRERRSDGVANAEGVDERRRRLLAGEEKVLPIGLERESSGDEGPEKKGGGQQNSKSEKGTREKNGEREERYEPLLKFRGEESEAMNLVRQEKIKI